MRFSFHLLAFLALLATAPSTLAQGDRSFESPYGFRLRIPSTWKRDNIGRTIAFRSPTDLERDLPTMAIKVVPAAIEQRTLTEEIDSLITSVEQANEALEEEGATPDLQFLGQEDLEIKDGKVISLTWSVTEPLQTIWEVYTRLPDGTNVILSFSANEEESVEARKKFLTIAKSFELTKVPEVTEGFKRVVHPIGVSLEVPDDWLIEQEDHALFFLPPAYDNETYPIALYLTSPIPESYDSLEKIRKAVEDDLEKARLPWEISTEYDLGGEDAWLLTWRIPDRREWTTQVAAIWENTLVALTLSARIEDLGDFQPIFDHFSDTLTLH